MTAPLRTLPIASPRTTGAALWRAVRRHPRMGWTTLLLTLIAAAGVVIGPILLGNLVDLVQDRASTARLVVEVSVLAVVMVGTAVFTALSSRAAERMGAEIAGDLRQDVLDRALRIDPTVLEQVGSGDVASRVTDDVERFVDAIPLVANVFTAVVTVVVATVGFAALDWRLALAFLIVFPIYWISLKLYLPRSGPRYAAERRESAERSRVLLESLHGASTVRAYRMQDTQTARVEQASDTALTAGLRTLKLSAVFGMSMNTAEAVGLTALIVTGFFLVDADLVTIGAVTAGALLFHRLFGPLGTLLMSFDEIQRAGAALARVVGVSLVAAPVTTGGRAPAGPAGIRVTGLTHSYDGRHEVVSSIDLDIPAGSSLAVVGASGAGKTTLAAIIGGAFGATSGDIVFRDVAGDVPISTLSGEQLRDWAVIVSQESHVFTGTLRDDLTFAAPDATDDALHAALDLVGAGWVRSLPDGLGTRVGAGEHLLDPAQVQQLALARIALKDPPIVVLDEATAEDGSMGARALEAAAAAVISGRTAIVVAHRLTQARACDRIAVMAHGKIVELGSHDDLVAAGGRYAALWELWSAR